MAGDSNMYLLVILLCVLMYGSGLLLWPIRCLVRGRKSPGKALRNVFLAQVLAYLMLPVCAVFIRVEHLYSWFFIAAALNVVFTIGSVMALCNDALYAESLN